MKNLLVDRCVSIELDRQAHGGLVAGEGSNEGEERAAVGAGLTGPALRVRAGEGVDRVAEAPIRELGPKSSECAQCFSYTYIQLRGLRVLRPAQPLDAAVDGA